MLELAREGHEEAATAAAHINDQGPGCVWENGGPVLGWKRHLELLLQGVDMLPHANRLCLLKHECKVSTLTLAGWLTPVVRGNGKRVAAGYVRTFP